jgi:hypothetical protein
LVKNRRYIEEKKMANLSVESQEVERIGFLDNSYENQGSVTDSSSFNSTGKGKSVATAVLPSIKSLRQEQFDKFLVQAIDEAITSLGEPVKNTIYQHLADDFGITKDDIPQQIAEFSDIIHKIFGLGATRLEIKFMKNLNSRIKADVDWPGFECSSSKWIEMEISFEEFVIKMRKCCEMQ